MIDIYHPIIVNIVMMISPIAFIPQVAKFKEKPNSISFLTILSSFLIQCYYLSYYIHDNLHNFLLNAIFWLAIYILLFILKLKYVLNYRG